MSCIKLKTINGIEIPLKDIKIKTNIYNHVAHFTITQLYHNDEENPIEAFYTFPTPSNASVFNFAAKIDTKLIKTILKEKEEARNDYNKAISDGNGAYLMERISGDVFSVSLGNIQPNTKIEIIIEYIVELRTEIDASQLRINFPLTIMPKYASINNITNEASIQSKLVNPEKVVNKPYDLTIYGTVVMTDGIASIDSKTCKIKLFDMKETSLQFEIDNLENLNEDIIFTIKRNIPTSSCLTQKSTNLQLTNEIFRHATMVNIVPKFDDISEVNPNDVHYTILLDKSGSMSGSDIRNCKEGAKLFLLSLPQGSSFDVYQFDDKFEKFKPKLNDNSNNILEAIGWIDKIECGGGTELKAVLEDVYDSIKQTNKRGMILLLSDGGISDTNAVLKLAKKNRGTSIFTIGIGQSVSQNLIQGLADTSNGKAEFVNSGTDQIKEKILAQLHKAQTSFRKDHKDNGIQIIVDGPYKIVPEIIPTLYENDINTFFIFSENPLKSVTYTQTFDTHSLNTNVSLNTLDNDSYPIHRMAGIKTIDSLANNPIGSQIEHLKSDPYKNAIIETSLNLGILSNYTSFIGVEIREDVDKTTQECILREVPLQLQKKYSGGAAGGLFQLSGNYGPTGACGVGVTGMKGDTGSCGPSLFDVNKYLPSKVNDDWFEVQSKSISFKNRQLINISKSIGTNTIGTSLKGASHDLRGAPECPKFVNIRFQSSYDSGGTGHNSGESQKCPKYVNNIQTSATIDNLPTYINIGNFLTAISVGLLPFSDKLKVNDFILVIGEGTHDGVYKILNIGSIIEKWILEKI